MNVLTLNTFFKEEAQRYRSEGAFDIKKVCPVKADTDINTIFIRRENWERRVS